MVKLFEWFETLMVNLGKGIALPIKAALDEFDKRLRDGIVNALLGANPAGTDMLRARLQPLIDDPNFPEDLKPILREWTSHTPPIIAAAAPMIGMAIAMGAIMAASKPTSTEVEQTVNAQIRPNILSAGETINAMRRGLIDLKVKKQEFAWMGYDDPRMGILTSLSEVLLDPDTLIRASWRGLLPAGFEDNEFKAAGYTDERKRIMKETLLYYPSPQDFITFAVRDTFNPDVVRRYGYDDQYPVAIDPYVSKAGISPEWMKHYWRAHWQLPSPTQMYEMLHRGKISLADAETLLKTADYAPYFIKPMLDISYNPYTRVDVNRMYDAGVLTKEEVKRAYLDLGYDEAKAGKLTEWATKEGMARERDLTQAQTLEAYNEGEISKQDATAALMKLGYDDKESALVLKLEDNHIERAYRKREKAVLVKSYVKGLITHGDFVGGLDTMKLTEREKALTIKEAKLQVKETKTP